MSNQDEGHLPPGRSPRTSVLGVAAPNMQPATRVAVHEVHPAEVEESQYQDPTSIDIEPSLIDLSARQELIVSQARSADPADFNLVVGGGETYVEASLGPSSAGSAFGLSSLDAALPTPATPASQPLRSTAPGGLRQNGMSYPLAWMARTHPGLREVPTQTFQEQEPALSVCAMWRLDFSVNYISWKYSDSIFTLSTLFNTGQANFADMQVFLDTLTQRSQTSSFLII